MTQQPRKLGRVGLTIWLLLPILIVWLLWLTIDRSKGKPDPRLEAIQKAQLPGQDPQTGRPLSDIEREVAETEARKAKEREAAGAAENAAGERSQP